MPRPLLALIVAIACLFMTVIGVALFFVSFGTQQAPLAPAASAPVAIPQEVPPNPPAPEPAYIPGTKLLLQSDSIDLADAGKKADPMIFVELPDAYKVDPYPQSTGLLRREFYRQAFLISATHGMGLIARDALLGEGPPEDLPQGNRFRVTPEFVLAKHADIKIEVGPVAASRLVWHSRGKQELPEDETHLAALTAAESLSRGEYLEAMKRGGVRGTAIRWNKEAKVPDSVETLLSEMVWTSQFRALRELNSILRKDGESPAILVALSRACANLAVLSERQLDAMTWVFKARGILYAERLRIREPQSPWGHWARSYAASLTGLHKITLDDIAAAEKVRGSEAVPEWVSLADAYARFDSPKLEAASQNGKLSQTATLLHFISMESSMSRDKVIDLGGKALAKMPDCQRIHETIEEYRTVGVRYPAKRDGFEQFTEAFPQALKSISGLPADLTEKWSLEKNERDQIRMLSSVGRSRSDAGEPTVGVVARYARETLALQIMRKIERDKAYGVSPYKTYEKYRPILEDHPLLPYMDQFGFKNANDPHEYRERLEKIPVPELSRRHEPLMQTLRQMSPAFNLTFSNVVMVHADFVHHDQFLMLRYLPTTRNYGPYGKKILAHSPYSPFARAAVIRDDWKYAAPVALLWEAEAQHPEVYVELAKHSIREHRAADAERQTKRAVELSPGWETYQLLAQTRKMSGDNDGFVEAMKQFISLKSGGLLLAKAHAEIAFHYMKLGDYAKAKPYAEEASASGSVFGMDCEARCLEGLEQWDAAEALMKRIGDAYPGDFHYWYFWCLRTGRGDLAAAEKKVDQYLGKFGTNRFEHEILTAGLRRSLRGRSASAAESYVLASKQNLNPFFTMLAAAEYEAAGDLAKRDATLRAIPVDTQWFKLSGLLRDHELKAKARPVTRELINREFTAFPEEKRTEAACILARFFQIREDKDLATEYFRIAAKNFFATTDVAGVLVAFALREIEKK